MTTFFGADGRAELDLRHFDDFIEALHIELVRLEYCHYDPEGQVRSGMMKHAPVLGPSCAA